MEIDSHPQHFGSLGPWNKQEGGWAWLPRAWVYLVLHYPSLFSDCIPIPELWSCIFVANVPQKAPKKQQETFWMSTLTINDLSDYYLEGYQAKWFSKVRVGTPLLSNPVPWGRYQGQLVHLEDHRWRAAHHRAVAGLPWWVFGEGSGHGRQNMPEKIMGLSLTKNWKKWIFTQVSRLANETAAFTNTISDLVLNNGWTFLGPAPRKWCSHRWHDTSPLRIWDQLAIWMP